MGTSYVDSSAALKRVLPEEESRRLARAIAEAGAAGHVLVTSTLSRVEIARALSRRVDELAGGRAVAFRSALQGIAQAPMTGVVVELAQHIGPPALRSLDAIHLATAIAVGADELWTYDERLADAATSAGIAVRAPS